MDGLDCVAGVELNVSCPNVKDGLTFGTHPGRLKELTATVKKVLPHKPLIVKLSPNVEDITRDRPGRDRRRGGRAVAGEHVHRDGDGHLQAPPAPGERHRRPVRARRSSRSRCTWSAGSTARSPSTRACRSSAWAACRHWQDAVEFILAGASAVAIGTALFVDPATPNKICDGLGEYLQKMKVERLSDLVGALELPGDEPRKTPYP